MLITNYAGSENSNGKIWLIGSPRKRDMSVTLYGKKSVGERCSERLSGLENWLKTTLMFLVPLTLLLGHFGIAICIDIYVNSPLSVGYFIVGPFVISSAGLVVVHLGNAVLNNGSDMTVDRSKCVILSNVSPSYTVMRRVARQRDLDSWLADSELKACFDEYFILTEFADEVFGSKTRASDKQLNELNALMAEQATQTVKRVSDMMSHVDSQDAANCRADAAISVMKLYRTSRPETVNLEKE